MLYLTDTQRSLVAPADGIHPYGGIIVPTSDERPFVQADAWCWALRGEYAANDDPYSAVTIYTSDEGVFVFNDERVPVGLNPEFFPITDIVFPQTVPYHQALIDNLANALAGNVDAQDACRLALMQLTATLNMHTLLPADGSTVYTMVMNSENWYGWNHWATGIQGPDTGATTTYQQKADGAPLQYNCGVVWGDDILLQTVLRLDGLPQPHITMLNNVV
ncbi:hypothetical protein EEB15_20340 [Ramlibacter sp. WS9]|nr:hypothetical protein EEB15_20340 [Ramlibacter sp. WS9]